MSQLPAPVKKSGTAYVLSRNLHKSLIGSPDVRLHQTNQQLTGAGDANLIELWFLACTSARGIAGNQSQEALKNSRSAGGFGPRTYGGPRLPPNRSHHADCRDGSGWRTRGGFIFIRRTAFLADLGRCARIRAAAGAVADSPASPPRAHPDRDRRPGAAQQLHL